MMPDKPEQNIFEKGKILLIDKPFGWTSFDVVHKVRKLTGVKKVGHAGTLDPLATGLLIICTGAFTKRIPSFMAQEKEYTGSFMLGAVTTTFDLESEPENFKSTEAITEQKIMDTARSFLGEIFQVPPAHSAIKIKGRRVYELARKGVEVKIEPRKVLIREFEILRIEMPQVQFRILCSTGTYIRSLAHDFGKKLGCGAYLDNLCRTRIGDSTLHDAMSMKAFTDWIRENQLTG